MKNLQSSRYPTIAILAGLFCMGYVASLFLTYSFVVMPGLYTIDDAAFVSAFQGLETRFQNAENLPGYRSVGFGNLPGLIAFPGAPLFSIIALVLNRKTRSAKWIFAAIILFIAGMITTVLYNLPSNEFIFMAGEPKLIDVAQVRKDFNETAWINWNHFRGITTTVATFCLTWALYLRLKSETIT